MNRNTRSVMVVGVLFILLGFMSCKYYEENTTRYTKNENINLITKEILNDRIEYFNEDDLEKLNNMAEQFLNDKDNNGNMVQANFILGHINIVKYNYEEAIIRLNEAISYFDNTNYGEVTTCIYYELSRAYISIDEYEKSQEAFNKAIKICEENNNMENIIKIKMMRANDVYYKADGLNKAIKLVEENLKLAKEINYKLIEDVYFKLGILYWYADRTVEAVNCKIEALSISEEKDDNRKALKISTDIGIDYLYSGNYSEAIKYFNNVFSYDLEDEYEDSERKAYALLNLVEAYAKVDDYENAKEAYRKFEIVIENQENVKYKEDNKTYMYANIADLQVKEGNALEALNLLDLAKERYNEDDYFSFYDFDIKLAEVYGDAYYKLGNYEEALRYHKGAEKLATERELAYLQVFHNEMIYLDYKAIGDNENTIKYLERNNELRAKLKNRQDTQYSEYLIKEFQEVKNLERISELEEAKEIMMAFIIALIIIMLITIIFTILIFKQNREIGRLNKLFKTLSVTDGLTNVPNRRALDEYLSGNWALYKKTYMPISFVMIDIDYFKKYNDNYGHPEGDKVLERVASSIKKSCRDSDFVARYGGEEFIVIMLNTDKDKCISVVEGIMEKIYNLNIKHGYSGVSDRITLSVGIDTAYIGSIKNHDEYIKNADEALYKAKENGRNNYVHASMIRESYIV